MRRVLWLFVLTAPALAGGSPASFFGEWRIVRYAFGNNVSVGVEEARKLLGRTVRYGPGEVAYGSERCAAPVYAEGEITAAQFLQDYRTSLGSVGVRGDRASTLTVTCKRPDGTDWLAPGGFALRLSNGDLLTVWDGVFYTLRRQR